MVPVVEPAGSWRDHDALTTDIDVGGTDRGLVTASRLESSRLARGIHAHAGAALGPESRAGWSGIEPQPAGRAAVAAAFHAPGRRGGSLRRARVVCREASHYNGRPAMGDGTASHEPEPAAGETEDWDDSGGESAGGGSGPKERPASMEYANTVAGENWLPDEALGAAATEGAPREEGTSRRRPWEYADTVAGDDGDGRDGIGSEESGPDVGASTTVGQDARVQALAWQEHVVNTRRLRRGITIGMWFWFCFAAVDVGVAMLIDPDVLPWLLTFRLAYGVVGLPILIRLHRLPIPSPGLLRVCDVCAFGGAALFIALMCVPFGGLESVYAPGIVMVVIARGVFVAEPWRRALLPVSIITASYPAVVVAAALVGEDVRAQFASPEAVGHFAVFFVFILSAAVITTAASHSFWALRQQALGARVVGDYRLEKILGTGGMGEVWRAGSAPGRPPVAVKLLRPGAGQAEAVLRFEREVAATSRLRHPNTVRIHDYGVTDDGVWYYAMELIDGEPLDRCVAREGPLAVDRAVAIARQLAGALAEAHAAGIAHRDVKPGNVLVTRDAHGREMIKLLDFGIARLAEPGETGGLTQTGAIVGSPAYMAPEAAAGRATDARADVYGAGAVLYLLLAGAPPFSGYTAAELLAASLDVEPAPPSQARRQPLPTALETLVARCLSKEPDDRFADGRDLADALDAISRSISAGTPGRPGGASIRRRPAGERGSGASRPP